MKVISTILSLRDNFSSVINKAKSNTKGFQNQVESTQKSMQGMKESCIGSFGSVAKMAGGIIAGIGIASFAKESVMLASDLAEVQNVIDTTFSSGAEKINNFAVNAIKDFGLSELQAKQFAGTMGSLLSSSGVSGDKLIDMSKSLAGLSADFASFYNLKPEEAFEKIKAGMIGSSEPLLSLGIDMREGALEAFALAEAYKKPWKSMSNLEKTQVRYEYLMKKGALANGDFKKTSAGFANQLRIAENQFKSLGAKVAGAFIPTLTSGLQVFNGVLDKLPAIGNEVSALFGRISQASDFSEIVYLIDEELIDLLYNNLPRGIADFIDSAYELIFGFMADILDNAISVAKDLAEPFKGAVSAVWQFIQERMAELSGLFGTLDKNNGVAAAFSLLKDILKEVLDLVKDVFTFMSDNWGLLEPVIMGVVGALIAYKTILYGVDMAQTAYLLALYGMDFATAAFGATVEGVAALFAGTFGWIIIAIGAVIAIGFALWKNWDWIMAKAGEFSQWISSKFTEIKDSISAKIDNMIQYVVNKFNDITSYLSNLWSSLVNVCKEFGNSIKNVVLSILNGIWTLLYPWRKLYEIFFKLTLALIIIVATWIYQKVTELGEKVNAYITNKYMYIYGVVSQWVGAVADYISNKYMYIYGVVSQWLGAMGDYISNKYMYIYGVVSQWVSVVADYINNKYMYIYNTVSQWINSVSDYLSNKFEYMYNTASQWVTNVYTSVVDGFGRLKDGIIGIFDSVKSSVMGVFDDIMGGIKNILNGGIGLVNSFIGGVNKVISGANKVSPISIPAIDEIPQFALGTSYFNSGGMALVGEHGPELINMPKGSTVTTANDTKKALGGSSCNVYVTIQGNLIGNEEYMEQTGDYIANKILLEMQR